jgi:hypothetical protein
MAYVAYRPAMVPLSEKTGTAVDNLLNQSLLSYLDRKVPLEDMSQKGLRTTVREHSLSSPLTHNEETTVFAMIIKFVLIPDFRV